ncbi:hypothetical protein M271_44490 [Streptomyces rapamycinicus NRRL 5491]|nr:hypothetical protein M271_44490 [Streptomyces rapamycinicus NRRL 5491]
MVAGYARLLVPRHMAQLPLRNIMAAELRAYTAKLEATVSSVDYRRGILSELSSILEAAVDDKRLARHPMHAKSVRWPKATRERREAWSLETALRVRDAISPRHRITVVLGLGCGLRQGEVFGGGWTAKDVLPRARYATRQCRGRGHVEHLHVEACAGRGIGMPAETPQILPRAYRGGFPGLWVPGPKRGLQGQ